MMFALSTNETSHKEKLVLKIHMTNKTHQELIRNLTLFQEHVHVTSLYSVTQIFERKPDEISYYLAL